MALGTVLWILLIGILIGILSILVVLFLYLTSPFRKLLLIRTLVGHIGDIAETFTEGFGAISKGLSKVRKGVRKTRKLRRKR